MDKRKLTLDDFVYQIIYTKRVPSIRRNTITSISRNGPDETYIKFSEIKKGTEGEICEGLISYTFRGEKWVEKDRGEHFSYSC